METIKSMYREMVQNYLSTKTREAFYWVCYPDEFNPDSDCSSLYPFSNEEIASLKALREKYGKDEFFRHLEEVFDEDTLHDLGAEEITGIILDYPSYRYKFVCHSITDKGLYSSPLRIEMSDETYVKMLELLLWDKDMNLNILKYVDESLYRVLSSNIDDTFRDELGAYSIPHPFAITFDELKEDAQKIREQYPDKFKKDTPARLYNPLYPYHTEL